MIVVCFLCQAEDGIRSLVRSRGLGDVYKRQAMGRATVAWAILAVVLIVCIAANGQAQVMGEEAELDRLRAKAEDAMGNDDAETAAMSMGRAALMASQLAKRQTESATRQTFNATEHLYRSQEHGYRAVALFRRAGGEHPPFAGACGASLIQTLRFPRRI